MASPSWRIFRFDTTSSVWAYWILGDHGECHESGVCVHEGADEYAEYGAGGCAVYECAELGVGAGSCCTGRGSVAGVELWLVSVLAAAGGVLFCLDNRKLDREEDKLNLLPSAQFRAKMRVPSDEESGDRVVEEEGSEKRSSE
jgi:hypothetical protein